MRIKKICQVCGKEFEIPHWYGKGKYCSRLCYRSHSGVETNKNAFILPLTSPATYWIGFLGADGAINSKKGSNEISLKLKDKEHIEKFREFIGLTKPMEIIKNKYYRIRFCSFNIVQQLKHYGIIPRKSLTFAKKNIPLKYERDFWRGMTDGDGWIYKKKLVIGLCGTQKICQQFKDFLIRKGIHTKAKVDKEKDTLYRVDFTGKYQVPKIIKLLYKNSSIFLERKHRIAQDICLL